MNGRRILYVFTSKKINIGLSLETLLHLSTGIGITFQITGIVNVASETERHWVDEYISNSSAFVDVDLRIRVDGELVKFSFRQCHSLPVYLVYRDGLIRDCVNQCTVERCN